MILGAILAGGEARRFGSDKALALLDGRHLLDHAADVLRPHVDALILCGREQRGWYCLPDWPKPGLGPLGGLAAALHHASAVGYDDVLTIGCDMPRVSPDLIESLLAHSPAYCTDAPVLGCWPARFAAHLDRHLDISDDRSVCGWARAVEAADISSRQLVNINTPGDLAAL